MIVMSIRPWVEILNMTHSNTSWQISTTADFTDILDETLNSVVYKNMYYSNVVVPNLLTQPEVYYVRFCRTLSEGTTFPWSEPIAVKNMYNRESVITNQIINIKQPKITIDMEELKSNSIPTITILGSSYDGVGDGHYCTHWIILNEKDEMVYNSPYDTVNLEGIVLNKLDIQFPSLRKMKIIMIYATATGVISKEAKLVLDFHNANYTINK